MIGRGDGPIDTPERFAAAFQVSRETLERLEIYVELLRIWQAKINLVAPATLPDAWHRHFADSAQVARLVPQTARKLLDLGSGAGFPGLVLAITLAARDRDCRVTLAEADSRKAAFLAEVARKTGTAVDIARERIEILATQAKFTPQDVIVARALAPLGRLLALSRPFWASGTVGLFLKGRDVEAEIAESRRDWLFDVALEPSVTDSAGRIAVVTNVRAKAEGATP